MPITNANVEKMLILAAKAGNMELDDLVKTIYQQDSLVLPKMFQERAKELLGTKPIVPAKEKSVWARKATKEYAAGLGLCETDITERTGKDGTIVLADVKTAYKAKKLAERTEKPKKEKKEKQPANQAVVEEKPSSSDPATEDGPVRVAADEGDEFEDEE